MLAGKAHHATAEGAVLDATAEGAVLALTKTGVNKRFRGFEQSSLYLGSDSQALTIKNTEHKHNYEVFIYYLFVVVFYLITKCDAYSGLSPGFRSTNSNLQFLNVKYFNSTHDSWLPHA